MSFSKPKCPSYSSVRCYVSVALKSNLILEMASSISQKAYRFLSSAQVQRLYTSTIASASPTQPRLLDSAIDSPKNVNHYGREENLFQLAANLSEKVMKNHAYQDGNKRTALLAADMFLKLNGYRLRHIPLVRDRVGNGLADAHVAVTTNQWSVEELGRYYEQVATKADKTAEEILYSRDGATEY
ncbi:hypothetical protein MMC31_003345 [Peltigera leucophlebia]|nr:hypothetical protein [Peltigera leucophlebia]